MQIALCLALLSLVAAFGSPNHPRKKRIHDINFLTSDPTQSLSQIIRDNQVPRNHSRHNRGICDNTPDATLLTPVTTTFEGYSRYVDIYWLDPSLEVLVVHLGTKADAPNLFISADGGSTFSAASLSDPVGSVVVSETLPAMIYCTSFDPNVKRIYVSSDNGATFTTIPTAELLTSIIIAPKQPQLFVALAADPSQQQQNDEVDDETDSVNMNELPSSYLWLSNDGGKTLTAMAPTTPVISVEWVDRRNEKDLPSIFVVTKDLDLVRWESPFVDDMKLLRHNCFNFEQSHGMLFVVDLPDVPNDEFDEKHWWISKNDGDTFEEAVFPYDKKLGVSSHFSLVTVENNVAVVVVEHQSIITTTTLKATVVSPSHLVDPTEVIKADFTTNDIDQLGNIVLIYDDTNPNGCGEFSSSRDYSNVMILIQRGVCPFTVKVSNAEDAGASGILVYGVAGDDKLVIMTATPGTNSEIAAFYVGYTFGKKLENYLTAGQGELRLGFTEESHNFNGGSFSRLYLSENDGIHFTIGLNDVIYDTYYNKPSPMQDNEIVDVYVVQSQPSTYLANINMDSVAFQTMITYNKGASWQPLKPPTKAKCDSNPLASGGCFLHLALKEQEEIAGIPGPVTGEMAVGLIIALGMTGNGMNPDSDIDQFQTYLSHDGGCSWQLLFDYPAKIQVLDHGGILTAIPFGTTTTTIKFSVDYGFTWSDVAVASKPINILGLIAQDVDSSILYAYYVDSFKWKGIKIDFRQILPRQCDPTEDYEMYSPTGACGLAVSEPRPSCLDGLHTKYRLRRLCALCFNGEDYDKQSDVNEEGEETEKERCTCTEFDFMCAPGFYRMNGGTSDCVLDVLSAQTCETTRDQSAYEIVPGNACHNTNPDVVAKYTSTDKPECKGIGGSAVATVGIFAGVLAGSLTLLVIILAFVLIISKRARTKLVRTVDTESRWGRFVGWFSCFRQQPTSFIYSQLAQDGEDDDVEFTVDGKDIAPKTLSAQIRRTQFALDDEDEDDDDILMTGATIRK